MTDLILPFSSYEIMAILEGRKTQFRQVFNPDLPDWCNNDQPGFSILTPDRHIEFRGQYPGDDDYGPGPASKFIELPIWTHDRILLKTPRGTKMVLTVSNVSVKRLQDISEMDAKAEGPHQHPDWPHQFYCSWIEAFKHRWNDTHKEDASWKQNPRVLAVSFSLQK